jgi:hypothetical protein
VKPLASPLDSAIRRELDPGARSDLLAEAVAIPSEWTRPRRSARWVVAPVLVAVVTAAAVLTRFGGPASLTAVPSHLSVGSGELVVRVSGVRVVVELISSTQSTELAAVEGGGDRPFIAQLVCSASRAIPGIVLFGFVGAGASPSVSGLPDGRASVGTEGTYLFVVDAIPSPGDVWTVTTPARTFSGPIGVWGETDVPAATDTPTCVAFDPSTAPVKP